MSHLQSWLWYSYVKEECDDLTKVDLWIKQFEWESQIQLWHLGQQRESSWNYTVSSRRMDD